YEMRCEGLAHLNGSGRLAWQVHFKQRPDKPVRDRVYRFGESGVAYPVALGGRAGIDAETFQVVRMGPDIDAPPQAIPLMADHTILEYGAVHFEKDHVDMWLPRTAEVYTEIRDRRTHRRHTFSDYFLFSVDDRQKIHTPKTEQAPAAAPAATVTGQGPAQ